MRIGVSLSALLLLVGTAGAATIKVPGDWPTIQEAVAAASDGDVIKVSGGPYTGQVDVMGFNRLTLRATKGVEIRADGAETCLLVASSNDVLVSGFVFRDAGIDGIVFANCENVTVRKCTILDSAQSGLLLTNVNGAKIIRTTIRNAGESGIRVLTPSANIDIRKCVIEDIDGNGIGIGFEEMLSGVDNVFIGNNQVRRVGSYGIVAGGENLRIEKNLVEVAGYRGIAIDDSKEITGAVIKKNTVLESGVQGIVVRWTGCEVTKNRVEDSGIDDILVQGSSHLVKGNRTSGGGEDGIRVVGSDCEIVNNKLADHDANGLRVSGTGNTCTGNSVSRASVGFYVEGTGNTFEKNKPRDCTAWDLVDATGIGGGNVYVDVDRQFPNRQFTPPPP